MTEKRPRSAADDVLDTIDAALDPDRKPNPFPFEEAPPAPVNDRRPGCCYRCGVGGCAEDVCPGCRAFVLGDSDYDPAERVRAAEAERLARIREQAPVRRLDIDIATETRDRYRTDAATRDEVTWPSRPCAAELCGRLVVTSREPALCNLHRMCDIAGCRNRSGPAHHLCPTHRPPPRPQPPDVDEPWSWRYDMPRACHELRYLSMTVAIVSDELLEDSAAVGVLLDRLRVARPSD